MADHEELERYVELVAARSLSSAPVHPIPQPDIETQALISHGAGHANIARLDEGTRFRRLKGLLLRVLRLITGPQVAYNQNAIAAVQNLQDQVGALRARLEQSERRASAISASTRTAVDSDLDGIRAGVAEIGNTVDELRAGLEELSLLRATMTATEEDVRAAGARLSRIEDDLAGRTDEALALHTASARLSDRIEAVVADVRGMRARVDALLVEARRRLPEPLNREQLQTFADQLAGRFDALYSDFERSFRGSRAEVKAKLQQNLPLVSGAPAPELPVVDVGCGRGEWLELLGSAGIEAYGIDVNADFVEQGKATGLDVRLGDALELLGAVPEGSIRAVTAIHIAEHLSFSNLVALFETALHALTPGGLLLIETPNPTNLVVGASSFYLDPTHVKPLHPELLEFLFVTSGFVEVEVRYLNPAPAESRITLAGSEAPELRRVEDLLNWSFFGPQDYNVVGRKPPGPAG